MSKEMTVIALGIWVVIVPYLGVPGSWRAALLVLTGIAIAILGFLLRGEALSRGNNRVAKTFVETIGAPTTSEPHEHAPEELTASH